MPLRRVASLLVLTWAAFGLAACGGSSGARGYLYRYGNGESFIQWQRHGHKVHGTIRTTQSCCVEGPARLLRGSFTVYGTISGSNVLLHYPHGVTVNGTLHSYGLLMRSTAYPVGIRYRRASVGDYSAAVAQTEAAVQRLKKNQVTEKATTSTSP